MAPIVFFFLFLSIHFVSGGQILSTNSYQLCNLTAQDPIQPSFLASTCTYFTRITSSVDAGQDVVTELPTIDMVGTPTTPFRDNTDNPDSLTTCGQEEICTITTPIDLKFTAGTVFMKWNLLYTGWTVPWSYVTTFEDGLGVSTCSDTGTLDPLIAIDDPTCTADLFIGPTPPDVCSEANTSSATCSPLFWDQVKKLDCFRMCCGSGATKSGRSYFVWETDTHDTTTGGPICKVYKPYSQPIVTQSLTVDVSSSETDFVPFSMEIDDVALITEIGTNPDPFATTDTDMPLEGRMIVASIKPYTFPNSSSINDYVIGSWVVICETSIDESAKTAKRPSCLNTPSNQWVMIPPTYASRYGTAGISYGASPQQILNAMAQSTDVCSGTTAASEFVPGIREDIDPPNPTITTKYSPSICDMMSQTLAGFNYWLPPQYDNTGGVNHNPNWFISGTKLYYRIDPSSVAGQTFEDDYDIQIDLTTNIMEYINTTSPGFFDPSFTKCFTTGYTNVSRTVAEGNVQVRVCNEAIVDNDPITQSYNITYTCDPRMIFQELTLTTDELRIGECQVITNEFTFLVSTVDIHNMSLTCDMLLIPGGDTEAGQATTTCNQFPQFLLPNVTCDSTDLSCFNNNDSLVNSAFFWILIGGGIFLIVMLIALIALCVESTKKKYNTPEEDFQKAAEPMIGREPSNIYANALKTKKTN